VPVPAADIAFGHRASGGPVDGRQDVLFAHMLAVDVVQLAVIGLGDDGEGPGVLVPEVVAVMVDHPLGRGSMGCADAMGVGDADRAVEMPCVVDPMHAGHLAIAVQGMKACPDGPHLLRMAARQDCRDTRPDRPFADLERAMTFDDRRKADQDALDIGDGIVLSGPAFEGEA
jgi:hypothetical protein